MDQQNWGRGGYRRDRSRPARLSGREGTVERGAAILDDEPLSGEIKDAIRLVALDPNIVAARKDLARFTGNVFEDMGKTLHGFDHVSGTDGASPFGLGNDSAVAVSMLLRIGGELVSGAADLIIDGRCYAGCALIRQLVEIEYLAWAFETKDEEAARWLRSSREERQAFFTPAKLRKAAEGRFRSVDYGYHCELGGHPVPRSWQLLIGDTAVAQLMLSDCLGHSGRIWDHVVRWSKGTQWADIVASKNKAMLEKYLRWKAIDALTALPPPPDH